MSLNYDSDDAFPRSPGLTPVRPKATPSPSPPPVVTQQVTISSTARNVSPPASRKRKRHNQRKTRPSEGDFVLIRVMDPNRPDIARKAGDQALDSDSGSEAEAEDEDIEEQAGEQALNSDSGSEVEAEDIEEQPEPGAFDAALVTAARRHRHDDPSQKCL